MGASTATARVAPSAGTAQRPAVARRRNRGTQLKIVPPPRRRRRSLGDVGSLLTICLFLGCLFLAVLHAVLVQNQARLDDLVNQNQQRQEQVDLLLAEIAYLDSPEGVAEQASSVGLVPAAEVVTLAPVRPGALSAPLSDPFGLAGLPPIELLEPAVSTDSPQPAVNEITEGVAQ